MKLSTKGRYGLRAMVDLAENAEDGPVSIQTIADRQELSEKYLEQLLGRLKRAGLVTSVRGIQGGYQVAGDPADISVGDVLRALEGDLTLVDCAGFEEDTACRTAKHCVTKYVWRKINDSIQSTVNGISLKELAQLSKSVQAGTWKEEYYKIRKEG